MPNRLAWWPVAHLRRLLVLVLVVVLVVVVVLMARRLVSVLGWNRRGLYLRLRLLRRLFRLTGHGMWLRCRPQLAAIRRRFIRHRPLFRLVGRGLGFVRVVVR